MRLLKIVLAVVGLGFSALAGAASGADLVPQSGLAAQAIKRNLQQVHLPDGFKIDLYAVVPDARHMAVGPSGGVVFVGTRKNRIWAVTDRNKKGVADEVRQFAPSLTLRLPNGVCFAPDGTLYSVELNRVLSFPKVETSYQDPDVAANVVVPQDQLVPASEASVNHGARTCRIGPDNKLYITLGNPFNVPPKEKLDLYNKVGMMGIIRMDGNGQHREVFTRGVRNSVGQDFNPKDQTLWFTDNQVDGMGDDIPPGELNRVTQPGQDFGFPYYGGGHVRTAQYKNEAVPANVVFPQVEMVAHAADLGMTFYNASLFPEKYRGGIFSAQHGSWDRTTPVGARIMFTRLKQDGTADKTEVFADGWLTSAHKYLGRPVDVAVLPDGSLLVSDDYAGAIYRISYAGR